MSDLSAQDAKAAKEKIISAIKMLSNPAKKAAIEHSGLTAQEFNAALELLERDLVVIRRHSYDHPYVLAMNPIIEPK